MFTRSTMIRVKTPDDVPVTPHYAVLVYYSQSVFVPGDERSRQSPGHGYAECYENYESFEHWVTADAETLNAFVRELEDEKSRVSKKTPYVIMHVDKRLTVDVRVVVDVK